MLYRGIPLATLANYRLEGFSVERLMHFLTALNRDIEIVIRPKPRFTLRNKGSRKAARIVVTAAWFWRAP